MSDPSSPTARKVNGAPEVIRWWHWVTGAFLILLLTFLAPRGKSPEFAHLEVGSISSTKIIAPFDFEILKSTEELKRERAEAAATVLPVMVEADSVREIYSRELLSFSSQSHRVLSHLPPSLFDAVGDSVLRLSPEDSTRFVQAGDSLFKRFGFRLSDDTWRFLLRLFDLDRSQRSGIYFHFFEESLGGMLLDVYSQGIINVPRERIQHPSGSVMVQAEGEELTLGFSRLLTPGEALERISDLLPQRLNGSSLPPGAISAAYEILQPFVAANIIYDAAETERRREAAIAKVPLAKGLVKKDELIIDSNIRVGREHFDKLNSLAIKRAELELEQGGMRWLLQIAGHLLLVGLVVLPLWVFIALFRPQVWHQWKLIVLVVLALGLVHLFQVLVPVRYELSRYLFPAAVGAMLLAILVDRGVALVGVVAMALVAGLLRGNDFPAAFSAVAVGSTALVAVKRVQARGDVMRTSFYLAAVYLPLVLAFHLIRFTVGGPMWGDLTAAAANALLSPILVLGLVFIFENLFGITTDLSLLELVDLNRPLLRELAIKSPGTYHHSIMVGSLAETAARAIGANALLTRAGAYYHDIGKMEHKEYFIENQELGSQNIHDRLSPTKSADVVIGHVQGGLELADRYRLPPQVKDFISEHHGRSRLAYFYAKAVREKGDEVPDEQFRYPGPAPQSRETGILMLADVVEAATRSIENHNTQELKDTVDELIRQRLADGDLDQCPLTLKEITQIRDAFVQVLSGIYHQRIPYPGQESTSTPQVSQKDASEEAADERAG